MGKIVNYLREYREIKALEARSKSFIQLTGGIFCLVFFVGYYSSLTSFVIPASFVIVASILNLISERTVKRKTKELGFESFDDFRECVEGAREYLEIRSVPDELIPDEQNRIIGDFVKGKKERRWKDVPEMFKGGGIYIAPPTKFQLNRIMETALSEDDEEEDEEIECLETAELLEGVDYD